MPGPGIIKKLRRGFKKVGAALKPTGITKGSNPPSSVSGGPKPPSGKGKDAFSFKRKKPKKNPLWKGPKTAKQGSKNPKGTTYKRGGLISKLRNGGKVKKQRGKKYQEGGLAEDQAELDLTEEMEELAF